MTNLKKSFGVLVFAVFSLAFCLMLVSQSAIADSGKKWQLERINIDGSGVPLPAPDEQAPQKSRLSYAPAPVGDPVAVDGRTPNIDRADHSIATLSTEQGGEDIGTAVALVGPFPLNVTGTTTGYAQDYNSTCGIVASTSPDVVYSYSPTAANTTLEIDLCASLYDTKVWVMADNGVDPLFEAACDDDGCGAAAGYTSFTALPVDVGTTYYIIIGGWNGDAGDYDLTLTEFITNLHCEAPLPIEFTAGDGLDDDSQDWAVDMSLGLCDGLSTVGVFNSLYFEFTAQASGLYTFSYLLDAPSPDAWFVGLAGAIQCPAAYALAYSPIGEAGPFVLQTVMLPGWTYEVECFDMCAGNTGVLTVSREALVAENDDCVDAIDLGIGGWDDAAPGYEPFFVHNVEATLDGPEFDFCDPVGETCGDVWYTWEAAATGFAVFDMCGYRHGESNFDSKIGVFAGWDCLDVSPRDALAYGCSDDGCGEFGNGGLVEIAVTAGDRFLIRVSGWFNDDNPCAAGGQGTALLDIIEQPTTIRPAFDDCPDVTPVVVVSDGTRYTESSNVVWASWGQCPTAYADGLLTMPWQTWHAVELTECSDFAYDFCGTPELPAGDRYSYVGWTDEYIVTGCPCEGDYNQINRDYWTYAGTCDPLVYAADEDTNVEWGFLGLIPGAYYLQAGAYHWGANSSWMPPYDYEVNMFANAVPCAICDGSANPNSAPPIGSATWIKNVTFADIAKVGVDYAYIGPDPGDAASYVHDMNGYEDHTDMIAHVYRGLDYDFDCQFERFNSVPDANDDMILYIDWNQNSGLGSRPEENNEAYDLDWTAVNPLDPTFHFYATISIPMDAALPLEGATGDTRMRLRLAKVTDGPIGPCGERVFGEVEDFTVEVADLECGDFDTDGDVDADDVAFLYNYYFMGGAAPDFWQRADMDNDGMITLADLIILADLAYGRIITVTCI